MFATPTPSSPFNCAVTESLPFGGAEVLVLSCVFIFVVVTFCVTFVDVGVKQMWPAKYLDPIVAQRVAAIQAAFPSLGQKEESDDEKQPWNPSKPKDFTTGVTYTRAVAREPYIAGLSVDEDLVHVLANGSVFDTVSSYCSSTVRGYAMLSTTLMCAGLCLGYLWVHNAIVDPTHSKSWYNTIALLGYIMVFFTGMVMCGPNSNAVHRNANICLFTNLPLQCCGKSNILLKLHELGIGSFCLLPLIGHGYRAYTDTTMLNRTVALSYVSAQLTFAVAFGACDWLGGKTAAFPKLLSMKCAILAEICLVFTAFLGYLQFEFYATAFCANYVTGFNTLMYAAMAAPFSFVVKRAIFAPSSFVTPPTLMLMNNSEPVAECGPCPALAYDQQNVDLPVVKMPQQH